MAIGTQQSASQLNGLLVQYTGQMNKIVAAIAQLQAYTVTTGAAGLQNLPQPFTAADATAFINAVNYLNTIAAIWTGAAAQTPAYNFQSQMAELIGPQPV